MKNLLLIPLLFASLSMKSQSKVSINENGGPAITFDSLSFDTETNIYVFSGNVYFKDEIIDIKNAQQVTLNSNTKELTAIGAADASIDGTVTIFTNGKNCYPGTVDYKLGSRRMYVNKDCH